MGLVIHLHGTPWSYGYEGCLIFLLWPPLVDLWSFLFYLVLKLLLCVPLVWWLLFHGFYFLRPLDHWYPILSQLLFYGFYFVRPLDHWYPILSQPNFILCFIGNNPRSKGWRRTLLDFLSSYKSKSYPSLYSSKLDLSSDLYVLASRSLLLRFRCFIPGFFRFKFEAIPSC